MPPNLPASGPVAISLSVEPVAKAIHEKFVEPGPWTLFWPDHVSNAEMENREAANTSGLLIGWQYSRAITVAALLPLSDVDLVDAILSVQNGSVSPSISRNAPSEKASWRSWLRLCKVPLRILGSYSRSRDAVVPKGRTHWLHACLSSNSSPLITFYHDDATQASLINDVVFYDQPNPVTKHYYFQHQLSLDYTFPQQRSTPPASPLSPALTPLGTPHSPLTRQQNLEAKLARHLQFCADDPVHSRRMIDLDVVLNQINVAYHVHAWIISHLPASAQHKAETRTKTSSFFGSVVHPHFPFLWFPSLWGFILLPFLAVFVLFQRPMRYLLVLLSHAFVLPGLLNKPVSLVQVSRVAVQVHDRISQLAVWPLKFVSLLQRYHLDVPDIRSLHIKFYNSVWLVTNDIVVGIVLAIFITDNAVPLASLTQSIIKQYTLTDVHSMITWLMGWPAGLKLNSCFDRFLGEMYLWLLTLWSESLDGVTPSTEQVIRVFALSGCLGASFTLSLLSDALSLVTLHLYLFYLVASKLFSAQLRILASLFQLFRGKRNNVLRRRVDFCDYELDQLLIGTILFTFLAFLFPTNIVYYLLFAITRWLILMLHTCIECGLVVLNDAPFFPLVLRLKDPDRIAGSVSFAIQTDDSSKNAESSLFLHGQERPLPSHSIHLKSQPMSFGVIFSHFLARIMRPWQHLVSVPILKSIATGAFISQRPHHPPFPMYREHDPTYAELFEACKTYLLM